MSLGALAHGFMSLRAAARRWREGRNAAPGRGLRGRACARRSARPAAGLAPRARPRRRARAPATGAGCRPVHDDDDAPWDEDDAPPARPAALSPSLPRPGSRRRHTAPKPGKRMAREAQPSLLDEENYQLPQLDLLAEPKQPGRPHVSADALEQNATLLEGTLEDFGVRGAITKVNPGPVVTLYELEPAPGTKSSRVISLADDIARSMSAVSARVAVVQGRNAIGIELPNHKRETVYLRELLASQDFETTKQKLALCLGKTIGGEPVIADLARMPHLLGRRHHRLGQVGGDQHHDPVAALPPEARPSAA